MKKMEMEKREEFTSEKKRNLKSQIKEKQKKTWKKYEVVSKNFRTSSVARQQLATHLSLRKL